MLVKQRLRRLIAKLILLLVHEDRLLPWVTPLARWTKLQMLPHQGLGEPVPTVPAFLFPMLALPGMRVQLFEGLPVAAEYAGNALLRRLGVVGRLSVGAGVGVSRAAEDAGGGAGLAGAGGTLAPGLVDEVVLGADVVAALVAERVGVLVRLHQYLFQFLLYGKVYLYVNMRLYCISVTIYKIYRTFYHILCQVPSSYQLILYNKYNQSTIPHPTMVTFMCSYCDTTLKKKQVQNHIRSGCYPGRMICIDCGQEFHNADHKPHVSCIGEQEKHWGEFAKKKNKAIAKEPKNGHRGDAGNKQQVKQKQVSKSEEKAQLTDNLQEQNMYEEEGSNWRGWKNQIKQIIRTNKGLIQSEQLRAQLKKRHQQCGQQQLDDAQFDRILAQKLSKISRLKTKVLYSLQ